MNCQVRGTYADLWCIVPSTQGSWCCYCRGKYMQDLSCTFSDMVTSLPAQERSLHNGWQGHR